MNLSEKVEREISRLTGVVADHQADDGSFRFPLEGAPMTDAYMIILLKTLRWDEPKLIADLAENLLRKRQDNGAWKLYHDEPEGNLSATVEAYYALLFAGVADPDEERWQRTKRFIVSRGGLSEAKLLTKVMLAMTGQYPWGKPAFLPLALLLLPPGFPISFYDFSGYARAHLVPAMVCADRKFSLRTEQTPDLSELNLHAHDGKSGGPSPGSGEYRSILDTIAKSIKSLAGIPDKMHELALRRAEQFMLERIEPDGLMYSYASTTFLMIFALLALGYDRRHPVVVKAVEGLLGLVRETDSHRHLQIFTSTVWDTALASYALQESGVPASHPAIAKAGQYLLSRQHKLYGDWSIRNPHAEPGGWGFSDVNTKLPDIDDTTAALRAIRRLATSRPECRAAWNRGLGWLLSMQNDDGGFAAFEKNTDRKLMTYLPLENAEDVLIDPSTADLTGRTLEFLGNTAKLSAKIPFVRRAVRWLLDRQNADGSWYGRWGIAHIYGTWAAVTGLIAVGLPPDDPAIRKAAAWMQSIQNPDGSFGESCASDVPKRYIPLGQGTPSQTAWAVDMLLAVYRRPTPPIERGIAYLTEAAERDDWTVHYPTGAGLPGGYYIDYFSYRYIWPLLALSHYKQLA